MDSTADRRIADMEGDGALPRSNGELVFQAPWEGRAFGIVLALSDEGACEWEAFREGLIAETTRSEASPYYERWLAALETLAVSGGLVTDEELDLRTGEYASGARDDDHW